MKRYSTKMLGALLLFGAVAAPATADMTGRFSNSWGTTGGGEFLFTPTGDFEGMTLDPFLTFCLERNEYMNFSSTFAVTGFDTFADGGGLGGGSPDPLSEQTAWLYRSFRDGSLADYGYVYQSATAADQAGHSASADALQLTIWGLEDELGEGWTPDAGLQTALFDAANLHGTGAGLGSVRVMNITWSQGKPAQSQLSLIPVPVPGAMLLGSLGLSLVAWRRKRQA